MANIALILAGGIGERMDFEIPKQFICVNGKPIIVYTLEVFQNHPEIDTIEVVCVQNWCETVKDYAKQYGITKLKNVVLGGKSGQDSIRIGITDIYSRYQSDNDIVLVHDAVRPLVSSEIITDSIKVCKNNGNAITVIPCTSAMLMTYDSVSSEKQIQRNNLKITQTPQTFFVKDLYNSHQEALNKGITDSVASCTMYVELGKKLYFSKGSEKNVKLTTAEDLSIIKALLHEEESFQV